MPWAAVRVGAALSGPVSDLSEEQDRDVCPTDPLDDWVQLEDDIWTPAKAGPGGLGRNVAQ